jgi:hypothetical protein
MPSPVKMVVLLLSGANDDQIVDAPQLPDPVLKL